MDALQGLLQQAFSPAVSLRTRTPVQRLWRGYGEVERIALDGEESSLILKRIQPPGGSDAGHRRKLKSYQVEIAWYLGSLPAGLGRLPHCFAALPPNADGACALLLEDLSAAGYPRGARRLSLRQRAAAIDWLAALHAAFVDRPLPDGLWAEGSYWQLDTRREEWGRIRGPLAQAAETLHARLTEIRYRSVVHGDAKPANMCFSAADEVAMVDFQYVGGGCGMRDLAYLLDDVCQAGLAAAEPWLDRYFQALAARLPGARAQAVATEWRPLFPLALADYHRFLAGWLPDFTSDLAENICKRL